MTKNHLPIVYKQVKFATAILIILIFGLASSVLIGYIFKIDILERFDPAAVAMNPISAINFILAGIALYLVRKESVNRKSKLLSKILSAIVAFIGTFKLITIISGIEFRLDRILFADRLYEPAINGVSEIAPNSAFCFLLIGVAIFFIDKENSNKIRLAEILAIIVSLISILNLYGYIYGVRYLIGFAAYIPMPLNSAIAFICTSFAILFSRPDKGIMAIFLSDHTLEIVFLRLSAFFIPLILGWFKIRGEEAGVFSTEFGTAIFAVCSYALSMFLIGRKSLVQHQLQLSKEAKRKLIKEDAKRLRSILNNSSNPIYIRNMKGEFEEINTQFEKYYHVKKNEIIGKTPRKIFSEDCSRTFDDADNHVLEKCTKITKEIKLKIDDTLYEFITIRFPLINTENQIYAMCSIYTDISELKTLQRKLKKSEALLKESQEIARVGTYEFDFTTNEARGTAEHLKIHGISEGTVLPIDKVLSRIHPEDRIEVNKNIEYSIAHQRPRTEVEFRATTAAGKEGYYLARGRFTFDNDGNPLKLLGSILNITELKKLQKKLEKSETLLKESQEIARVGTYEFDFTTNEARGTAEHLKIHGIPEGTVLPIDKVLSRIHPDDLKEVNKTLDYSIAHQRPRTETEFRATTAEGKEGYYWARGRFTFDKDGNPLKLLGSILNITEIKTLQKKLEKSEALLKESQEIAQVGTYEFDYVKNEARGTAEHLKIHGIPEGTVLPIEKVLSRIHPEDLKEVKKTLDYSIAHQRPRTEVRFRATTAAGNEGHYWARGRFTFDKNGNPLKLLGTILNMTDLVNAEKEIQNIKEFVVLADSIPQLVWTSKTDGSVDYANKRFGEYIGKTSSNLLDWEITNFLHPEQHDQVVERFEECIKRGKVFESEHYLRRHDGIYRWFLVRSVPLKNELDKIIKWIGSCTDIHEHKEKSRQLKEANRQLKRINADLDNFIYTASHDLKTPVTNLEGLTSILSREAGSLSATGARVIRMMKDSTLKLKNTIKDLTEIGEIQRDTNAAIENVCFKDITRESMGDLHEKIKSTKAIIHEAYDEECIHFNRRNLKIIIDNLLSNSIKFRSPDRPPEIFVETTKQDDYIVLKVKDNGVGFDIHQTYKMFSMFRRLHDHVEGTGVGLYIVKRIMENSGGRIDATGEVGKGAEFKIFFPIKRD